MDWISEDPKYYPIRSKKQPIRYRMPLSDPVYLIGFFDLTVFTLRYRTTFWCLASENCVVFSYVTRKVTDKIKYKTPTTNIIISTNVTSMLARKLMTTSAIQPHVQSLPLRSCLQPHPR